MEARRERTDFELFDGEPPPDGLRLLGDVLRAWPAHDFEDIAQELGAKRGQVSYAIHVKNRHEGRKLIEAYTLTGTYGEGENYDPSQDQRALDRATLQTLAAGATQIAARKRHTQEKI